MNWTERQAETASLIIKPLAHPHRLLIIRILTDGKSRSVHTLAHLLGLSRTTIFKHLAQLSACGLVTVDANSQTRRFFVPTEHMAALVAIIATVVTLSDSEGATEVSTHINQLVQMNHPNLE
ncbi:Bacterial regulatory protein, arsR family [compost metagenome]